MSEVVRKLVEDYPVRADFQVAWGDMDAFQHVNNTVFFRYFESGRIAYFDRIGVLEVKEETGIGPILAASQCRFRLPLTYPDTVTIGTRVRQLGEDRFTMEYRVVSHRHERLAAEGDGRIVYYDYGRAAKAPIPEPLRQAIEALEDGAARD